MAAPACPKCSISLQEGYLLEDGGHGRGVTQWIEGRAVPSFWQGVSTKGKQQLAVVSYRCPRCGLLEMYAAASDKH